MSWSNNSGSTLGKLLTWLVVGVIALIALRLAFWAVKAAWSLGAFLLVTVVPIVLVGWLAIKFVQFLRKDTI